MLISSPQNPKIKNLVKLQKPQERRKQKLTVIEGFRELTIALSAGFEPETVFYCKELGDVHSVPSPEAIGISDRAVLEVTKDVFQKVAYREGSDGYIAVGQAKELTLESIQISDNPLIIVLESVEKPGNLGAILRTADAAQVDAVIVCDPKTDLFNPNVIRSSIGCVFTTQVAACSSEEAYQWLKKSHITIYSAALTAEKFYHETDLSKPAAIVMGTEADGLSEFWLTKADAQIKIPMQGKIDSLNVSTSCAVLVFEAKRQRKFSD